MATAGEFKGVRLAYVARTIKGDIKTVETHFDKKNNENVQKEVKVKEPVIVFFPNGTSQVFPAKVAEKKGFLTQPDIINLDTVGSDTKTAAGRYKNAIRVKDREDAWLQMENNIVTSCIAKHGHPLPLDVVYSDQSMYLDTFKEPVNA